MKSILKMPLEQLLKRFVDVPPDIQEPEHRLKARLEKVEPLVPLAMGIHGIIALYWLYDEPLIAWLAVGLIIASGILGLIFPSNKQLRNFRILAGSVGCWAILANTGGATSLFLIWFFILMLVYIPLLNPPYVYLLIGGLPLSYIALPLFVPDDIPLPVVAARAGLLGFLGVLEYLVKIWTKHYLEEQNEIAALKISLEQQRRDVLHHFITSTSHDLRNRLTIIKSSAYLLNRYLAQSQDSKVTQHLEKLETQSQALETVLLTMLKMSELEDHESRPAFKQIDLNDLVETVVDLMKPLAFEKQQIVGFTARDKPLPVWGDWEELCLVFKHLMTNALSYTPDGGRITILTCRQGKWAVVEISDTGIGISAFDLPQIFDHFYRADKARAINTGGVGLGLTISKKIIELHQGHIEAESALGNGSLFRVSVPAAEGNIPTPYTAAPSGI